MDESDKGSRAEGSRRSDRGDHRTDRGDRSDRGDRGERGEREGGNYSRRDMNASGSAQGGDRAKAGAMEVLVDTNVEKAMKILKRKLIKEGLFKELKSRRYYEKPSDKKKRKMKESIKKARKDEARSRKNNLI